LDWLDIEAPRVVGLPQGLQALLAHSPVTRASAKGVLSLGGYGVRIEVHRQASFREQFFARPEVEAVPPPRPETRKSIASARVVHRQDQVERGPLRVSHASSRRDAASMPGTGGRSRFRRAPLRGTFATTPVQKCSLVQIVPAKACVLQQVKPLDLLRPIDWNTPARRRCRAGGLEAQPRLPRCRGTSMVARLLAGNSVATPVSLRRFPRQKGLKPRQPHTIFRSCGAFNPSKPPG
jgi:hypothetical protein